VSRTYLDAIIAGTLSRVRRILHDVQRDLPFYRVAVEFRDGVEGMLERRGRLLDPDHVFHGFGPYPRHWPRGRRPDDDRGPADDGLAGSRVPRRPPGDAGGARVEIEPIIEGDQPTEGQSASVA
jgi:hypothetical protein